MLICRFIVYAFRDIIKRFHDALGRCNDQSSMSTCLGKDMNSSTELIDVEFFGQSNKVAYSASLFSPSCVIIFINEQEI